jgi:hypothetical protein
MKQAVLQHERNFELTARKIECVFCPLADEIETCQTCVDIEPSYAEVMNRRCVGGSLLTQSILIGCHAP